LAFGERPRPFPLDKRRVGSEVNGKTKETARLDVLLSRHRGLARRKAKDVIEKGQVSVDGETVLEPGRVVLEGAVIHWNPHKKALSRARLSLPRLYGDESLVIVDKPAGLLTVPTSPDAVGEDTVAARVADYARHLHPRHPYVGFVHRIDRDTSGALAFALTPDVRGALRTLFREHRIERRYAAIVEGVPKADTGLIDLALHDAYLAGKRRVARPGEPSRPALTRFSVVERFLGAALLEVELETGRQHQIRVHLAHLGLPILGDPLYRPKDWHRSALHVPRQMLHARLLGFVHPVTGEALRVESPLPGDFKRVLQELRGGRASRGPRAGPGARRARPRTGPPPGGRAPRDGTR
jgi:23S rRNA pseudouridine1911/1915/1917 synthase